MKTIANRVYNPNNSLFKSEANARAEAFTISCSNSGCSNETCPLLAKGQCILTGLFSGCPYGRKTSVVGPTKRAKGFYDWISKHSGGSWLEIPPRKLAFIGEYVWLPYAHMDMCKEIAFSKREFIKLSDFNITTILALTDFRPHALFGGEIRSYQKEHIPLFVAHLKELVPELYLELISLRPNLIVTSYLGRKALLRTLNFPITIPAKDPRYPVEWEYDGKTITTKALSAYNSTWGGIKLGEISITAPVGDSVVTVINDSWVNNNTEFVD